MTDKKSMINKRLFASLKQAFGKVSAEKTGIKGSFAYDRDSDGRYRLSKSSVDVGEEFRVNCPFCGDTKQRLYINHLWGTKSSITGKLVLWLAHCFNEECLTVFENRKDLYDMVYGDEAVPEVIDIVNDTADEEPPIEPLALPGMITPLRDLVSHVKYTGQPHPALTWCHSRDYDPLYLNDQYSVGYCSMAKNSLAAVHNRLFVPVLHEIDGSLETVAWTARKVMPENPDDASPKWVHSYGTIGRFLYNLHAARYYRTIVVTEGPGDAWAVGPNAVALLGKTVQKNKVKLLREALAERPTSCKSTVVVLLDPTKDKVATKKNLPHHIETATKVLTDGLNCPILPVYLPQDTDPGSLDSDFIWACIKRAADKHGIYISRRRV